MEKEVRFTKKRVDESWKENVSSPGEEGTPRPEESREPAFSNFLTSLGIQALVQMGEMQNPATGKTESDLTGAQETIDLLVMLKRKTKGNLSQDEEKFLSSLIADLQLKYVQHRHAS
ncbi:MAG: DUF1844 domain-containing protein [Candidatus Omnitrophica bacterium]|nr:DUF1844 domain-containing protein [Candidatus Omnitrophota bacterium]